MFQLNRDGSSWIELVLRQDKCVLLKDHNAVKLVRLEPAAPQSRVKHSTTELLSSPWTFRFSYQHIIASVASYDIDNIFCCGVCVMACCDSDSRI